MAEGWGKHLLGDKFNFYSAGTKTHGLNQRAVAVMKEVGIDISEFKSKLTTELPGPAMDFVFTVCSDAHENCPYFPAGKVIHVGFDDPPRLTKDLQNEEQILTVYRRVRDEIKEVVTKLESYMK
jgi:arsenate reductase